MTAANTGPEKHCILQEGICRVYHTIHRKEYQKSMPCPEKGCEHDTRQRKVPEGEPYCIHLIDPKNGYKCNMGLKTSSDMCMGDLSIPCLQRKLSHPLSDMCMERNGAPGQEPGNLTDGVLLDMLYWIQNAINDGQIAIQTIIVKERIQRLQKLVIERRRAQPQDAAAGNELIWMTPEEEEKRIREDERRKIFEKVCSECPIKEEIPTDDERCAESCEGCLIRSVYLSTPTSPGKAGDVLAELEQQLSRRTSELKSWIKIAEINGDEQRKKELLSVLGEVQSWWAALRQVQQG